MQKTFFKIFIMSALSTLGVSSVQAGLTVYNIDYELYSDVDVDNDTGLSAFDSDDSYGSDSDLPSSFDDFVNAGVGLSGATASAGAHMNASVYDDLSPLSVELDMGANAEATASVVNAYGHGYGFSSFIIDFSTDMDYLFSFSAEYIDAQGASLAEAILSDSAGNELFSVSIQNDTQFPFIEVVGGADDYSLSVTLDSEANADFNSNVLSDSSSTSGLMFFEAKPAPVPVPAALPLMLSALSIFGVIGFRRR